jgi:hypothetical protein
MPMILPIALFLLPPALGGALTFSTLAGPFYLWGAGRSVSTAAT